MGDVVEVPIQEYPPDFSEGMVAQLAEEIDIPYEKGSLVVRMRPYEDFKKWAVSAMEAPDWQRYTGVAAHYMYSHGLLDEWTYEHYDSPEGFLKLEAAMRKEGISEEPNKFGLERYVNAIADEISKGEVMPPLLTVNGKPADGVHRTLAAMQLGLDVAPVAEISEIQTEV